MSNGCGGRFMLCLLQPRPCPPGRFRTQGTGEQGEPSDRERCGAILSQVLGPESPLCHLGTTQVGGCAKGQAWLEGGGGFGDKPRVWWSFWVVGRWVGAGWQVSWAPRAGREEAPTLAGSSPRLCPQVLLQEPGWQQLEQHWAQRRAQALLILHRGLRACISRQRLRLLPRMQARVRGLQARSAGLGRGPGPFQGGGAGWGDIRPQGLPSAPSHQHWTLLTASPPIAIISA